MEKLRAILISISLTTAVSCPTAFAQDLQPHTGFDQPKSDFQRAMEHPIPPPAASRSMSTEVQRGNYYGGVGSGSNLHDQHGQPAGGLGVHGGKHFQ